MKKLLAFVLVVALAAPALAQQPAGGHDSHHAGALSDGEVRKVDKDGKKITIKHGPLANLDMPAMTMVFQVQDAALLNKVKPGDKVKFQAEKIAGGYAVTRIEPAQ